MKEAHKETFKNLDYATINNMRFTCEECGDIFPTHSNLVNNRLRQTYYTETDNASLACGYTVIALYVRVDTLISLFMYEWIHWYRSLRTSGYTVIALYVRVDTLLLLFTYEWIHYYCSL